MKLPRLAPETKRLYESVIPAGARVETRSMFGGLGSFVNGNMFAGALGDRIFLRLADADREEILREPGGGPFEPVKGRPMTGYATVPRTWEASPARIRDWAGRALEYAAALPPKKPAKKAPSRKR